MQINLLHILALTPTVVCIIVLQGLATLLLLGWKNRNAKSNTLWLLWWLLLLLTNSYTCYRAISETLGVLCL